MGSRKEFLKSLCIPEYPWSSEDEEPPADPRPAVPPRTVVVHQSTPTTASLGNPGRSQVPSRELFMSLLNRTSPRNGSDTANHGASNNRSDMSVAYIPRANHTPAPDMLLRVAGNRDDSDIRRVIAFKRLTRNMGAGGSSGIGRYPRYSGYTIPRNNSRPGTVVPSESNSSFSMRLPQWRRTSRNASSSGIPGPARQIIIDHSQLGSSTTRRHRSHSLEVHNSDDDEADESIASSSTSRPAIAATNSVYDEPTIEQEAEVEPQVSSNDTSGTGVSLEEEIVEIVDTSTTVDMDLIDRARPVMPSSNDPNLASTSRADDGDVQELESQGAKRKRRASSAEKPSEPFTVKQFNQSLLRLLECPVCLEWMEPPMSQCRRGHLVCSRCRARLASCPVCRTTFSSVRNRAMEGVAEMLRYPCRHGCGREVRLRRRAPHEASCAWRKYTCPAPLCTDKQPLPRDQLAQHFHAKHLHLVKLGAKHRFGIKVNSESHDNWLIIALDEFFHMKVDVDIRTWGVIVYVAYIGPKCNAKDFAYQVSIDGQHNGRKMIYRRSTHSDLESSSLNVSRQDCFHLTLDQALNFIRFKNRHCDAERFLEFDVEVSKIEPSPPAQNESDS